MKLNLLPASVGKGNATKVAWILSPLLVLLCTLAGIAMQVMSADQFNKAREAAEEVKPRADRAVATANEADAVVQQAAGIIRNTNLAQAMISHNSVYPRFYDQLFTYIPTFYRLMSVQASPVDANTAQVTLTGTIRTFQQYADLPLALMRIPGAQGITRSGFQRNLPFVPGLSEQDRVGIERLMNEPPVPQDPLERLAFLESQSFPSGFLNVGNFGTEGDATRGAMPDESVVTMTLTIVSNDRFRFNLQTPNPRATLGGGGGGATGGARPGMPGGMPPGIGGPPPGVGGAPAGGGRAAGAGGGQEGDL